MRYSGNNSHVYYHSIIVILSFLALGLSAPVAYGQEVDPAAAPKPVLTYLPPSYKTIDLGASVILTIRGRNDGGSAQGASATFSFPDYTSGNGSTSEVSRYSSDFGSYDEFSPGEYIYDKYGNRIRASYMMVESYGSWGSGETHSLSIRFTPSYPGTYTVLCRISMQETYSSSPVSAPSSGTRDQQGHYNHVVRITVNDDREPDLEFIQSMNNSETANAGDSVTVYLPAFKNSGNASTSSFYNGIYLSTNSSITTSDIRVDTKGSYLLAAGQSVNQSSERFTVPSSVSPGSTYYIGYLLDYRDDISESSESNNDAVIGRLTIPQASKADLRFIQSVGNTKEAKTGESVTINLPAFENNGGTKASGFYNGVYLSTDQNITTGDTRVDQVGSYSLNPGSTVSSRSVTFTVPSGLTGGKTYYIGYYLDYRNDVPESSTSNNSANIGTLKILQDADADLEFIQSVSNSKQAKAGDTFSVSLPGFRNSGDKPANNFRNGIYLSTDSNITTSDTRVGYRGSYTVPAGGSISSASGNVTLPDSVQAGKTYYLGYYLDYTRVVTETSESNNDAVIGTVTILQPDKADLRFTQSVSNSESGKAGDSVSVNLPGFENSGGQSTGSFYNGVYLSSDSSITPSDTRVSTKGSYSLSAGSAQGNSTATFTIPGGLTQGKTYYIGYYLDYRNDVSESSTSNNDAVIGTLVVQEPGKAELQFVESMNNARSASPGDQISIQLPGFRNSGETAASGFYNGVYISTDQNITTGDTRVDTMGSYSLNAGSSRSSTNTSFNLPSSLSEGKTYYIGYILDYRNDISESSESNNDAVIGTVSIPQAGKPDLLFSSSTGASSHTAKPGTSLSISTPQYRNAGDTAANGFYTGYYWSTDSRLDGSDTRLQRKGAYSLSAGGSRSDGTVSMTIPGGAGAGRYYILMKLDDTNTVDESDESSSSNIRHIATVTVESNAPGTPSGPTPSHGSTGISLNPTLSWSASGADSYDVYFGRSSSPGLHRQGVSNRSVALSSLQENTTYYWKVVARNSSSTTEGPVWRFTTLQEEEETGSVRGTVTDSSGNAIRNVAVRIAGKSDSTDTGGSYYIDGLSPGNQTITASHSEYADYRGTVSVSAGTTVTYNFSLSDEGSTNEIRVGQLTLRSDSIVKSDSNTFSINGRTVVNGFMIVNGRIDGTLAPANIRINGSILLEDVPFLGSKVLYAGSIDLDANRMIADAIERYQPAFSLFGFSLEINGLELLRDGVRVSAVLKLPAHLFGSDSGIEVSSLEFRTNQPPSISGAVKVTRKLNLFNFASISNIAMEFDTVEKLFGAQAAIQIRGWPEVEGGFTLLQGRLQQLALAMNNINRPIGATGLFLQRIGISGQNITDLNSLILGGDLRLSGGPRVPLIDREIIAATLEISLDFSGEFAGSGALLVLDFETATASVRFSKSHGFSASAGMNILNILRGNIDVAVRSRTDFSGTFMGTASMELPWFLKFLGDGTGVAMETRAEINQDGFQAQTTYRGNGVEITFHFQMSPNGKISFGSKGQSGAFAVASGDTVVVQPGAPYATFSAAGSSELPRLELIRPDGVRITPTSGDVHYYGENSAYLSSGYVINNPMPGTWRIDVTNDSGSRVYSSAGSSKPILVPGKTSVQASSIRAELEAFDSDDDSTVSLYWDDDERGFNGSLIASKKEKDGPLTFTWDKSEKLPDAYYLYAEITDGTNQSVSAYFDAPVLQNGVAPARPRVVSSTVKKDSIRLKAEVSSEKPAAWRIYYDQNLKGNSFENAVKVSAESPTIVLHSGHIPPGRKYRMAVAAINRDGVEGPVSKSFRLKFKARKENNYPGFRRKVDDVLTAGTKYVQKLRVKDYDKDTLSFKLLDAPKGMELDRQKRKISWKPALRDIGTHYVSIRASDGKGGRDVFTFALHVVQKDKQSGHAAIQYTGGNSGAAIITYSDWAWQGDSGVRDRVTAVLTHAASGLRQSIELVETSAHSKTFRAVLAETEGVAGAALLQGRSSEHGHWSLHIQAADDKTVEVPLELGP